MEPVNNNIYSDQDLRFDLIMDENTTAPQPTRENIRVSSSDSEPEHESDDDRMSSVSSARHSFASSASEKIDKKAESEEKRRILTKLRRYEMRRGIKLDKSVSMYTSLDELRLELELVKKEVRMESTIDYGKRAITMCAVGIEILNKRYDPLDIYLDGWSASVDESIDDYDEILEELYDKYYTSVTAAPEVKLILGLVMSAVMYNITNKMLNPTNSSFLSKLSREHGKQPVNEDVSFDGPSGGLAESILREDLNALRSKKDLQFE